MTGDILHLLNAAPEKQRSYWLCLSSKFSLWRLYFLPVMATRGEGGETGRVRVLLSSSHITHRHVFYKVFILLMVFFNGQWKKEKRKSEAPQNVNGHFDVLEPNKAPMDHYDTTQWCSDLHFFVVFIFFILSLNIVEQRDKDRMFTCLFFCG